MGRESQIDTSNPNPPSATSDVVVVADDNEDIRNLLRARLSNRGFEVFAAADGQEALELIRRCHPDIAILDWVMPVIQGHELCVKLKTDPDTADIPVVMLTARGEEEDRLLGIDLGADAYIVKPFDIEELDATLKRLIALARSPQQSSIDEL